MLAQTDIERALGAVRQHLSGRAPTPSPAHGQAPQDFPVQRAGDWFTPVRFTLLLALLLAVTFPGILFGTHSFFFRDYGVLSYPSLFYARESFWRGELPLWNPLSHCGVPFLAQWGAMVLYPFSIIYLLFPVPWSVGFFCLLHLLLGGVGMHALASRWTGHGFAGAFAGVAYVFNGVVFSTLAWPNYTVALGWLPWVVLATHAAWLGGGPRRLALAALAGAMQMLSGVPEVILLTWALLALLLLAGSAREWFERYWACAGTLEPRSGGSTPVRQLLRFAIVVALVGGLCAAQLLPFFELLALSHRHSAYGSAAWSMPAWGWANLFVPLFRAVKSPQGVFYQPGHVFLITYYLGVVVMVLAALGLAKHRPGASNRQSDQGSSVRVYVLAACALLGLVVSLGDAGYLYAALKQLFPVIGFARYPIKCIYLTLFTVPLLAAYGIQHLQAAAEPRVAVRRIILVSLLAALLCAAVLWIAWQFPRPQHWPATLSNALVRIGFIAAGAALLVAMRTLASPCESGGSSHDLAAQPAVPGAPAGSAMVSPRRERWQLLACLLLLALWLDAQTHTPLPHPTTSSQNLKPGLSPMTDPPKPGKGRALLSDWAEDRLYRSRVADFGDDLLGKRLGLWCNLHLLEGIPKVEGASTLLVREQAEIQNLFYRNPDTHHPALADFLGVTHVNAPEQVTEWVTRTSALPLVTAGQQPIRLTGTNALPLLTSDDFDPRAVVYVSAGSGRAPAPAVTRPSSPVVTNIQFQPHRIIFDVHAPEQCLVTIAQTFYPAWRASIGGREVPIIRVNHAFQAVEVAPGDHRVTLAYVDRRFQAGAAISTLSLALCGLAVLRRSRD